MLVQLFGQLEKLINEHGSATILKERLALMKEQFEALERRCTDAEAENSRLRQRCKELEALVPSVEFHEYEGLLWKPLPSGGYQSKPYCPVCQKHPVMSQFPPGGRLHWVCSVCDGMFDYAAPPK